MIGDIVRDVEARQIASLLPFDLVDQEVRKHEAAFLMLGVRQRIESFGKGVLLANLLRARIRESLPRLSRRELDANSVLHRFRPVPRNTCGRAIANYASLC